MRGRILRGVALLGVLGLVAAACGSSGRELRDPPVGAVAPFPVTTVVTTLPPPVFSIQSSVIGDPSQSLPEIFLCEDGQVPPLHWYSPPGSAVELALSVVDVIGDGRVHLLVTGLDPTDGMLVNGNLPAGASFQSTTSGTVGWDPPCPEGDEIIELSVTLYALPQPLQPPEGAIFEDPGVSPSSTSTTPDGEVSVVPTPELALDPQAWLAAIESTVPARAAFTMLVFNG